MFILEWPLGHSNIKSSLLTPLLSIFPIYLKTAYQVFWQNGRITDQLIRELGQQLSNNGSGLKPEITQRIHSYTLQSRLTNTWFSALRGFPVSEKEQHAALYVGAITPLLDDLTDKMGKSSIDIWKALKDDQMMTQTSELILVKYLDEQLKKLCSADFHVAFKTALLAQDESMAQMKKNTLTKENLIDITRNKGGAATFLYRQVLTHPTQAGEIEVIYCLGFLLQLINDAFDLYKDFQNEQQTLYTQTSDISAVYDLFRTTESIFLQHWQLLDYPKSNLKSALKHITVILGRGHVCFEQLTRLQNKNGGHFELEKYTRQELICDMESPLNLIKSIRFSSLITKKFNQM